MNLLSFTALQHFFFNFSNSNCRCLIVSKTTPEADILRWVKKNRGERKIVKKIFERTIAKEKVHIYSENTLYHLKCKNGYLSFDDCDMEIFPYNSFGLADMAKS